MTESVMFTSQRIRAQSPWTDSCLSFRYVLMLLSTRVLLLCTRAAEKAPKSERLFLSRSEVWYERTDALA